MLSLLLLHMSWAGHRRCAEVGEYRVVRPDSGQGGETLPLSHTRTHTLPLSLSHTHTNTDPHKHTHRRCSPHPLVSSSFLSYYRYRS